MLITGMSSLIKIDFQSPIFINACARTGGTLLTAILDSHTDVAMSYEIYEDLLLKGKNNFNIQFSELLIEINNAKNKDEMKWVRKISNPNIRSFTARVRRGGLSIEKLVKVILKFERKNLSLDDEKVRMDFIHTIMTEKAIKLNKTRWGGKVKSSLYQLKEKYPDAIFFSMLRDGRDVLSSRLNTGNFDRNVHNIAREWVKYLEEFEEFTSKTNARSMLIDYEKLVREPEKIIKEICNISDLCYQSQMLSYENETMSLFKAPHGHLSIDSLRKGINQSSIGRWKKDLNEDELSEFMELEKNCLNRYGFI